jgi:RNA polymerase sigma-70 factor (ECF subfamily)
MAEMDSQRHQDELLASVILVAPVVTDEVLIATAKLGDRLAFIQLWARHSNTAFKMAYRIVGNRDDAEDAIQEAWLKAYVHLNTFEGRSTFSSWLTRITINSALMTLRRRRTHPETSMETAYGEAWQPREIADRTRDPEELYALHERIEHLRFAICRLHPSLRNVVEIRQSDDRSVKEVAELAGISVAATKSRLLRARTILRKDPRLK